MDGAPSREHRKAERNSFALERFIATTFEKLPAHTKVLIGLFGALNSASDLTARLELSEKVWEIVRFDGCGPLQGQSEEVNWLKGVCDGILLVADYS